jgi:hypothetical protein
MMDSTFARLSLNSTSYTTPTRSVNSVIPWNVTYSGWDIDLAATNPYVLFTFISTSNLTCVFYTGQAPSTPPPMIYPPSAGQY